MSVHATCKFQEQSFSVQQQSFSPPHGQEHIQQTVHRVILSTSQTAATPEELDVCIALNTGGQRWVVLHAGGVCRGLAQRSSVCCLLAVCAAAAIAAHSLVHYWHWSHGQVLSQYTGPRSQVGPIFHGAFRVSSISEGVILGVPCVYGVNSIYKHMCTCLHAREHPRLLTEMHRCVYLRCF